MSNPAVAEARTPIPNIIDIYMHEMATRARTIQSEVATSNTAPAAASSSAGLEVYLNPTRAGTQPSDTALAHSADSTAPNRSVLDVYLHSGRATAAQDETISSNSTAAAATAASSRSIIDIYFDSITDGRVGEDPPPNGNASQRSTASAVSGASNTSREASQPPQAAAVANAAAVVVAANDGGGDGDNNNVRNNAATRGDAQRPVTPLMRVKLFELSTSSSDSEDDSTRPAVDGSGGATGTADSRQAASPPPNCAICLGRCKNKCFTDSCMHQFCFKCLCEWSKVKPECPLCKQTFKSIIHNVKSMDQFEEYHVQPPTVQIPHRPIEVFRQLPYLFDDVVVEPHYWEAPRRSSSLHRLLRPGNYYSQILSGASGSTGGNSGTGSGNGSNSGVAVQNQFLHRSELLDMYRREAPDAIASSSTLSQLWRRFIYDRKLFALPVCDITGRFRDSSARFYRDNPAQIHRLMPWISRDIICLLRNTEHDASTLLERINESLIQSNILSPAFRRRLQPYLGTKTSHFIHELNNFARSPYDMIGYDRAVQYLPQSAEEIVIEFSSSGSSDEANTNEVAQSGERIRRNEYRVQLRAANSAAAAAAAAAAAVASQPPMVNLLSFTISTTSEGTEAPGVTVAVSGRNTQSTAINLTTHNRATDPIIDLEELDGLESASGAQMPSATPTITDNIELTSSSSDECEFVLERKPPHLRTPELVSLNSESDSDVVFVEETKPLRKVVYSTSEDEQPETNKKTGEKEQRAHAKRVKAFEAQATALTVKSEHELYNVGASTSTGLRSSGGVRGLRSLREQSRSSVRQLRRRSSPRGTKETEQKTVRRSKRKSSDSNDSLSDSESSTSDSEDDDYSVRRRHVMSKRTANKKRAARSLRKPTSKRSASRSNDHSHSRKRIHSKDGDRVAAKKHKSDNVQTHSECSSDEDEGQSLIQLKRRLQEQKQSKGKEASWYGDAYNDAGNDDGEEQAQEEEEDKSSTEDVKPADSSISLFGDQFEDNVEATVSGAADENTTGAMANSDDEPSYDGADNINSLEPSCSHQAARPVATEPVEVPHFATSNIANAADTEAASVNSHAGDEQNTFASVTQTAADTATTTVTTTSTTAAAAMNNERLRAHSRTSTRSFATSTRTSTASDNSSSSTSSSATSLSSPSLYSASSGGEEEDSNGEQLNNGQSSATQLRFEQLFDHNYTGEPWLMDELGNVAGASYEGEEQRQQRPSANDTASVQRHGAANETAVALTDFSNACASLLLNSDSSLLSLTDMGDSSDAALENL